MHVRDYCQACALHARRWSHALCAECISLLSVDHEVTLLESHGGDAVGLRHLRRCVRFHRRNGLEDAYARAEHAKDKDRIKPDPGVPMYSQSWTRLRVRREGLVCGQPSTEECFMPDTRGGMHGSRWVSHRDGLRTHGLRGRTAAESDSSEEALENRAVIAITVSRYGRETPIRDLSMLAPAPHKAVPIRVVGWCSRA